MGSGLVFLQAEDGIRDLVRSRGLGDVYKRQSLLSKAADTSFGKKFNFEGILNSSDPVSEFQNNICLLYTSDAADERSSVDLGGRRIIKKKKVSNTLVTASLKAT